MNFAKIKSLFLKVMIGCLIAAAALAVITILSGRFNDISTKALVTILLIAVHSLISFGFIVNNEKQKTFDSLEFFTNITFIIIVLSFITSIFGVWGILHATIITKLYATYFVMLFAALHGETLNKVRGKQANIDNIVYANYVFMAIVVVMLMVVIFVADSTLLGAVYFRLLASMGIIDATLTLLAVILHKLYVQKHPTIKDPVFNLIPAAGQGNGQQVVAVQPKRRMNIFVILLIIYIAFQVLGALFVGLMGAIRR